MAVDLKHPFCFGDRLMIRKGDDNQCHLEVDKETLLIIFDRWVFCRYKDFVGTIVTPVMFDEFQRFYQSVQVETREREMVYMRAKIHPKSYLRRYLFPHARYLKKITTRKCIFVLRRKETNVPIHYQILYA